MPSIINKATQKLQTIQSRIGQDGQTYFLAGGGGLPARDFNQ